jgi:hypothetical protein
MDTFVNEGRASGSRKTVGSTEAGHVSRNGQGTQF